MAPKSEDINWHSVSVSTACTALLIAAVAGIHLVKQIESNVPWNFDHVVEVLLLSMVVLNVPSTWFWIRKERASLLTAVETIKATGAGDNLQSLIKKSITKIIAFVFMDLMIIVIAFQGLMKH